MLNAYLKQMSRITVGILPYRTFTVHSTIAKIKDMLKLLFYDVPAFSNEAVTTCFHDLGLSQLRFKHLFVAVVE